MTLLAGNLRRVQMDAYSFFSIYSNFSNFIFFFSRFHDFTDFLLAPYFLLRTRAWQSVMRPRSLNKRFLLFLRIFINAEKQSSRHVFLEPWIEIFITWSKMNPFKYATIKDHFCLKKYIWRFFFSFDLDTKLPCFQFIAYLRLKYLEKRRVNLLSMLLM